MHQRAIARAAAPAEPRGERGQPRGAGAHDRGVRRAADAAAGRRADLRRRGRARARGRARLHAAGSTVARSSPASARLARRARAPPIARPSRPISATIDRVRSNILAFQRAILHRDVRLERRPGIELGLRYRPLRRVGVCIPGGAAAYPSTLLMTVVPAQAAGVEEIAVVVPPTPFGGYNADLLAACHALGVNEVYRIGGAQAVAALAYGVDGIASSRSTRSSGRATCSWPWPSSTSTARSTSTASPGRARSW